MTTPGSIVVAGRRTGTTSVRKLVIQTPGRKGKKEGIKQRGGKKERKKKTYVRLVVRQYVLQQTLGGGPIGSACKSRAGSTACSASDGHFISRWTPFDGFQQTLIPPLSLYRVSFTSYKWPTSPQEADTRPLLVSIIWHRAMPPTSEEQLMILNCAWPSILILTHNRVPGVSRYILAKIWPFGACYIYKEAAKKWIINLSPMEFI